MRKPVGFRQIHLDFHTSPLIPDVGADFDPEEFAATLKNAHVNSINLFARGHHGMLYYDSKAFPERVHPGLQNKNMLKEQAEACRKLGIHVNAYTTLNWDIYTVREHPEWVCVDKDGKLADHDGIPYLEPGFYINLCANTGYREFLKRHLEEVLRLTEFDGVWIDASFLVECCCPACLKLMAQKGLDPRNPAHRKRHAVDTNHDITRYLTKVIRDFDPDLNILYNKSHVGFVDRPVAGEQSYFAFESLPGGAWGYLDFPISVRYNRNEGNLCAGMTGRFHTSWGDTHSYRNQAALEYECFQMLAQGARCIIGDQLHPRGRLDAAMYEEIGRVYASVEAKEPWCDGAASITEIGVISAEEFLGADAGSIPSCDQGACRMLQELSLQFDFLDSQKDFSRYSLIILPDEIPVSPELAQKLEQYILSGGKVIASCRSGLDLGKNAFASPVFGVDYLEPAPYAPEFLPMEGPLGKGLPQKEHVMYLPGVQVAAKENAQVLEWNIEPYFNRTWEHFSSHQYTPSSGKRGAPAIVQNGGCIYFSHPIFSIYDQYAPAWCKTLVDHAVERLAPNRLVRHSGPSTLQASLLNQRKKNRWVLHLLHYIPERRCQRMDVIQDVIPLYDTTVSIHCPQAVEKALLVPEGQPLPFQQKDGTVTFTVPKIHGHQMVCLEFGREETV